MLDIVEEQRILIEKLVKSNAKYVGNEDLFDDFCNEVYKRSCHVLNGIKDVNSIESYLRKVVQSSILGVLKDLGRVRRLSHGYTSSHREIPVSSLVSAEEKIQNISDVEEKFYTNNFGFGSFDYSSSIEETLINKDLLKNIVDIVFNFDVENPDKQYLEIFKLRYKENRKQNEIAQELSLSQSEVSKRLVEISKFVKSKIEN